jgi:hypothetical protein
MRKTLLTVSAALAVSVLTPAPTLAQSKPERPLTAEETADLHCMAIYSVLASQPEQAASAAVGVFYFLGRLEGRDAQTDWLERFHKFVTPLTEADLNANTQRCGQALIDRGQALTELGERMARSSPAA